MIDYFCCIRNGLQMPNASRFFVFTNRPISSLCSRQGPRCRRPAATLIAGTSLPPCVPHCPSAYFVIRCALAATNISTKSNAISLIRIPRSQRNTKPSTLVLFDRNIINHSNRHVSTSDVASLDTADVCMTGQTET